jgi:anthranilate synthase component 1
VDREGVIRTRPIKGTRRRGRTPAEDDLLRTELRADPKERAENLMIVDLMRNDLERIATPGTVAVTGLFEVETLRHVHQLVSTLEARIAPGTTVSSVLDATFPAGSMTGAPKHAAMTLLQAMEGGRRGVYSGCFGRIGSDGSLELAMTIRSIVIGPTGATVGAGGGITAGSVPGQELAEVALKARALLAALGVGTPERIRR